MTFQKYQKEDETLKYPRLYEIKPRQYIRIRDGSDADGAELFFDHLDGMYSVCYTDAVPRQIVHLAAYTPVEVLDKL